MKFLPENYQAPTNSNKYMKLQDGENKIRILSAPILGWEDWIEKKPIRFRFDAKPCKSQDPKKPIRHFWAFIVWNYKEEKIQILQLTQATIRNNIEALCKDEDWGEPYFYDLKIIRKGEGVDTEYMVNPLPHKEITAKVMEAFKETPCNLEALFDGEDPFSMEWETYTTGIFNKETLEMHKEDTQSSTLLMSEEQIAQLEEAFDKCDPNYFIQVMTHLKKSDETIDSIEKIPAEFFDRIYRAAVAKSKEKSTSKAA